MNLSVTFGDSSPSRGATGEPVLAVLDEQSFLEPKNEVLRCLGRQHLCEFSLVERRIDVVCLSSGARLFMRDTTLIVQQGLPDLPKAPLHRGAGTR